MLEYYYELLLIPIYAIPALFFMNLIKIRQTMPLFLSFYFAVLVYTLTFSVTASAVILTFSCIILGISFSGKIRLEFLKSKNEKQYIVIGEDKLNHIVSLFDGAEVISVINSNYVNVNDGDIVKIN